MEEACKNPVWPFGPEPINITARTVIEQSPFDNGALPGGVLAAETDRVFLDRKRG